MAPAMVVCRLRAVAPALAVHLFIAACGPGANDVRWSTVLPTMGEADALAVAVTGSGAVVAGGFHHGELTAGSFRLPTAIGRPGVFVVGLGAADGAPTWLSDLGLQGSGLIEDLAAAGEDVYVVGSFSGTIHSRTGIVSSTGAVDAFVARLSGTDGANLETIMFGGAGRQRISSIAVIREGEVLIAGDFTDELTLGQRTVVASGGSDGFVARLSLPRDCLWVKTISGPGEDEVRAVTYSAPFVGLAGSYESAANWHGSALESAGVSDIFVSVLSGDDGRAEWTATLGSGSGDFANDVAFTEDGALWMAGLAGGQLLGEPPRMSDGSADAILASFSPRGDRVSLDVWGALGFDEATGVVGAGPRAVTVGTLRGTVAFGGSTAKSARDSRDAFVVSPGAPRITLLDHEGEEGFRAAALSGRGEVTAAGHTSAGPWIATLRAP